MTDPTISPTSSSRAGSEELHRLLDKILDQARETIDTKNKHIKLAKRGVKRSVRIVGSSHLILQRLEKEAKRLADALTQQGWDASTDPRFADRFRQKN